MIIVSATKKPITIANGKATISTRDIMNIPTV